MSNHSLQTKRESLTRERKCQVVEILTEFIKAEKSIPMEYQFILQEPEWEDVQKTCEEKVLYGEVVEQNEEGLSTDTGISS
jgi:hypothetical protein